MNRKTWIWLQREVISWSAKGLITRDVADDILASYGDVKEYRNPSLLRLLVILLGLSLLGMGVFLLFAGYWYSFSPNGRFDRVLALLALASMSVAIVMGSTEKGHIAREVVGVFYFFATCSSAFLVGDTYYLGEDNGLYLLITILLSLPIAYLLESHVLIILYLLGAAFWSITDHAYDSFLGSFSVWPLLLLPYPYYQRIMLNPRASAEVKSALSWALMLAVYAAFFFNLTTYEGPLTIIYFSALSVMTYSLGKLVKLSRLWTLPFRTLGMVGLLYVAFKGTFVGTWASIYALHEVGIGQLVLAAIMLSVSGYMTYSLWKRKNYMSVLVSLSSFVIAFCAILASTGVQPLYITVIYNTFVFLTAAIATLRASVLKDVSLINGAIFSVLAILIARFFDPTFTFVERGISFLVVGAIVIGVNFFYMWNKRRQSQRLQKRWQEARARVEQRKEEALLEEQKELIEESAPEEENEQIEEAEKEEGHDKMV